MSAIATTTTLIIVMVLFALSMLLSDVLPHPIRPTHLMFPSFPNLTTNTVKKECVLCWMRVSPHSASPPLRGTTHCLVPWPNRSTLQTCDSCFSFFNIHLHWQPHDACLAVCQGFSQQRAIRGNKVCLQGWSPHHSTLCQSATAAQRILLKPPQLANTMTCFEPPF